jgi:hypothetical protein
VKADLNYERQPQVFATVKAEDTNKPPHFAYAQIRIDIADINDEKPQLMLVRILLSQLKAVSQSLSAKHTHTR